jgi:hypothetical protein
MIKKLLLAAALSLVTSGAFAACTNPMAITANAGTVNMSVSQNTADAGCMYNITPNQGGAPLSATNGWWTNILQGNVALSATNGLYANILQGNVANSAANPFFFAPATSSVWSISAASGAVASGAFAAGSISNGANPVEGTITTAHGCLIAGYTIIGCLGQIDDDVKGPIAAGTNTIGTTGSLPYPVGAVPITASATGTTAATTATLAGTTGKTTYVCGYSIRANATANTNVTNTLTGVISGTMSSAMWVPANTAGLGVDEQIFQPCIPASAANTAIAAVSGAPGTGGVVTVKAWGFQL